mgnify:CR=1 FL=1
MGSETISPVWRSGALCDSAGTLRSGLTAFKGETMAREVEAKFQVESAALFDILRSAGAVAGQLIKEIEKRKRQT